MEQKQLIKDRIEEIYHKHSGIPGYRMMRVFLERMDIVRSSLTVHRYMKEMKLRSVVTPKKPKYKKGDCHKRFGNLLQRDFTSGKPNTKWCTDFTYIFLRDGSTRYNCSIIDLYDRSAVATLNSERINAQLAIDTLKVALGANRTDKGLILHSDQGSQFTSRDFTEFCLAGGIVQSMSKAGCPFDNSPMESFYGTFKAEYIKQHDFVDDEELNEGTFDYVYRWYNHLRPHSSNGYLTPFEKRFAI